MFEVFLAAYIHGKLIGYASHPYNNLYECYSDIDQVMSKDHIDERFKGVKRIVFTCDVNVDVPYEPPFIK